MGLGSLLKSYSRLLRLARKPGRTEVWLTIKVCALGIVVIGMVGFVIKLLSAFLASVFPI